MSDISSYKMDTTIAKLPEISEGSGVIRKVEGTENLRRRKPPTAVQALRRKYQEQRLAKQRASTLKKLAQKVKGKNMVRTRSATHNEEEQSSVNAKSSKGNIDKKTERRVNIVQRKIRSTAKPDLLARNRTVMKIRTRRTSASIRRDGLRSGGQLPPGSEAGLKSERTLKHPVQLHSRFKPVVKKKIVSEKSTSKTFASSVSDFSSDDDQPLAKKIKPLERASASRQLARKVIKRIVTKRLKPRMITRSQQQQTVEKKEETEARIYTRPSRKTKEAAAIYMELLGRKLVAPEVDADEDSLSIDSFPELPNARRIDDDSTCSPITLPRQSEFHSPLFILGTFLERRENEIKARASKEKKEAETSKEVDKTLPVQKSKALPSNQNNNNNNNNTAGKQKHFEFVKVKKLTVPNKKLVLQKNDVPKNLDKVKSMVVLEEQSRKELLVGRENVTSKKQDSVEKNQQVKPRKILSRVQSSEDGQEVELEDDVDKMGPPSAPRRSMRRGSRDMIQQSSSSETPPTDPPVSKNVGKKSKAESPTHSPSPPLRQLRNLSKTCASNLNFSEDKFSDSDEEPLGKIALKNYNIKKNDDVNESDTNKEALWDKRCEKKGGKNADSVKKISKKEESSSLSSASNNSDGLKKKTIVKMKTERVLKIPVVKTQRVIDKKLPRPDDSISTPKITVELPGPSVSIETRLRETSPVKKEDNTHVKNKEINKGHEDITTRRRELLSRKSQDQDSIVLEKMSRKIEDIGDKDKETSHRKNEENGTKTKETLLKRSEVITKSKEILLKKNEESDTTKNEMLVKKSEDHKIEEVPTKRTREGLSARNRDASPKKNEVNILKRNDNELQSKKRDTSPKKNEGDFHTKKKESSPKRNVDELLPKKDIILRKSDEGLHTKNKDLISKQNEKDLQAEKKDILFKKNKDDLSPTNQDAFPKKTEEVNLKNKEVLHKKSKDVSVKKKESPLKSNEDGNNKNKEIANGKNGNNLNTKNKDVLLKVNEESVSTGRGSNNSDFERKETSHRSNEEIITKCKEEIQRKTEDSQNTQSLKRKIESDLEKELFDNRIEEVGHTKIEELSLEKTEERDATRRKTDNEHNKSENILLKKNEAIVNKKKDGFKRKSENTHIKCMEIQVNKEEEIASERKDSLQRKVDCTNIKTKEISLKKNEEICNKKKDISLKKLETPNLKNKEIFVKVETPNLNNKDILVKKDEDISNKQKDIFQKKVEDKNVKIKEVFLKKNEESSNMKKDSSQRKTGDIGTRSKDVSLKKKEKLSSIDVVGRKDENIDARNEQLLKDKEIYGNKNAALQIKVEDIIKKNKEILPQNVEDSYKNLETPQRKIEEINLMEMLSRNNEDFYCGIEDDKEIVENAISKLESLLDESDKSSQSQKSKGSEALISSKIAITKGDLLKCQEEKPEIRKQLNMLNMINNVISEKELENENLDKDKKSPLLLKKKSFHIKTESDKIANDVSNTILPSSYKQNIFDIRNNVTSIKKPVTDSILSKTIESTHKPPENEILPDVRCRTSPKRTLEHSHSKEDIIFKKLPKEDTNISNIESTRNDALKVSSSPFRSISYTTLKEDRNKTSLEQILPKHENKIEKVDSQTVRPPITSNVGIAVTLRRSDTEKKQDFTKLNRNETNVSNHAIEFKEKIGVLLNKEPVYRERGKSKVNMSNEQIEKWLNESYTEEIDSKKEYPPFERNEYECDEEQETLDYMNSIATRDDVNSTSLEGGTKLSKGAPGHLKEVSVSQMYKSDKVSTFRADEFQQKDVKTSEVTGNMKNVQQKASSVGLHSPQNKALALDERNYLGVGSAKEIETYDIKLMSNNQQQEELKNARMQKLKGNDEDDISKEKSQNEKLQSEILTPVEGDLVMPGSSSGCGTVGNQIYNPDKVSHETMQSGNIHALEGVKENKIISEMKKQETGNTSQISASKLQSVQDRFGEKKSIFQQRRSFPHKAKERKDLTPSANAFSPENESSVYAFETEPELPPISTPFRRRARDSRTSSTTTSKSEEDLARLDDEVTPPVTTQSSVQQSTQSERLPLPVVGQTIQTLPLATAVVQIIPTLPITMRPVKVESFIPSQPQQQQQQPPQQQQQQLLLLQNDAVMTTLKTGSTSSTSIAVQVNLDNEPSLDTSTQNIAALEPPPPEPIQQRSMECSTQTDVAEDEEDDSEGHLFYIPLQQPSGSGGSLTAPSQQLIQGVAVKLGTEGPTGPNQRVIMRAKLVTKPPNFNRSASGIQDGNTLGIGRSMLNPHQRPAGMLMMDQKNIYGSTIGSSSSTTTGTYPPVGTVQPTARGRPLVPQSNQTSDATTDTLTNYIEDDSLKVTSTSNGKSVDISSGLYSQSEMDHSVKKPLAMVSAKPIISKVQNNTSTSVNNTSSSAKLPLGRLQQGTTTKERRSSIEINTPSTSSSILKASAGNSKRSSQKLKLSSYLCKPSNSSTFPDASSPAKMVEAPIFHPTEKEFQDPLEYIDRIRPVAEKFGLCRVVPPPNFKPECKVTDDMRFLAYNQYVHKMLHRWGPNVKEMMAIKKYLATQSISFIHPPWIGGMEVDLPRLYKIVQSFGGLKEVIEKKKWHRVADGMKIPKSAQDRVTKLDDIYCKYLLPYDTLSPDERQKLFDEVEKEWLEREKKAAASANAGGSDGAPEDECESDATDELDECIVKGRNMPLNAFYRIARNTMSMWFRQAEPPAAEVEQEFWRHVTSRQSHVCVHSGSIDSSGWGYGFPCSKNSPFARHPWNLKVLTNNSGSILRSIGPIMGVTVPTLHVGMLFTTCCWYRDPHGLPWVEYLHTGANKIWYGIPDEYSSVFRSALTKLVPQYCRSKTIWLPSDTAMVPPPLLVKHGVPLCHTVQEPGQFILVFPRAFTSSICTGYLVSESVYFAQPSWLNTAEQVFKDIQNSCEPSMFSLERLLFSIATDGRANVEVLKQILPMVLQIRQKELDYRKQLYALGLKTSERLPLPEANIKRRKARQAREEEGDYECEMCRANLFVSLVTNSHEEGVYCLPHAVELLTKKRHHLKYCKLMYTYDQAELHELIQKLQDKIETKSQRKSQGKHSAASQKL